MGDGGRRTAGIALALTMLLGVVGCSGGSDDAAPPSTNKAEDGTTTSKPVKEIAAATDFSGRGITAIAHRGASLYAPEHTFAAYDLAVEQGADYIEQDVQLTKDGQLVVLHDPSLDRTARGPAEHCTGFVSQQTVEDLAACEAGSWFNEANPDRADPAFAALTIPTLRQVFDRYLTDTRYYIEVKAPDDQPGMVDALLELLDEVEPRLADRSPPEPELPRIVIQSFSAESLRKIHELRPDLPLVQLIRTSEPVPDGATLDAIAEYAVAIGPPKTMATPALVGAANDRCLDVHPYTVDDPAEMTTMLENGVGGMFTDAPDRLVDALDPPTNAGLCAAPSMAGA